MKLSTEIICFELSRQYKVQKEGERMEGLTLQSLQLLLPGKFCEAGTVYIANTDTVSTINSASGVLIVLVGTQSIPVRGGAVIRIEDPHADFVNVTDYLMGVFNKYNRWERVLHNIIKTTMDVAELLLASEPILENPIEVLTSQMHLISTSAPCVQKLDIQNFRMLPPHVIELARNADDTTSLQKRQTPFFSKISGEGDAYCINLYASNTFIAVLMLRERSRKICERDRQLFQFLKNHVEDALKEATHKEDTQYLNFRSTLKAVLDNQQVDLQTLREAFGCPYEPEDKHLLFLVGKRDSTGANAPNSYICTLLERSLLNGFLFEDFGYIICITSRPEAVLHDLERPDSMLSQLILETGLHLGLSHIFSGLSHLRQYFREACIAYEMGIQESPRQAYFRFEDYMVRYMLKHACGEFSPEFLVSHELNWLLRSRNCEAGTDYWHTLQNYLGNECNATLCSKDLFLHRSSLIKRMEQIKRHVAIQTPEDRFRVRMLMKLYDVLKEDSAQVPPDTDAAHTEPQPNQD